MSQTQVLLGSLKKGSQGKIVRILAGELTARLLSMGILEGAQFTVAFEAPFGRDPLAIRIRGSLIALRRGEANFIEVDVAP